LKTPEGGIEKRSDFIVTEIKTTIINPCIAIRGFLFIYY